MFNCTPTRLCIHVTIFSKECPSFLTILWVRSLLLPNSWSMWAFVSSERPYPSAHGRVAEWSKALDLGSNISGCVGSNPTSLTLFFSRFFFHPLFTGSRVGCFYLTLFINCVSLILVNCILNVMAQERTLIIDI